MPSNKVTPEIRRQAIVSYKKKLYLEPFLASDMRRSFRQMIRSFMITYPRMQQTAMPSAYYADVTGHLRDHYRRVIKRFKSTYRDSQHKKKARQLNPDNEIDKIIDEKLHDYILEHSEDQARVIIRTTESELRKSILKIQSDAAKAGKPIDANEIAKLVADDYSRKINGRASVISTTETNGMAEKTKLAELGAIRDWWNDDDDAVNDPDFPDAEDDAEAEPAFNRIWVAVLDDHTRDAHAEADGQEVEEGQPFVVDGEELESPGDPSGSPENIINCRCDAVAIPAR